MGQDLTTAAKAETTKAKSRMDAMVKTLDNKLQAYQNKVKLKRGDGSKLTTEVGGGRTLMRQSAIRVATSQGIDEQIKEGIASFFKTASGSGEEAKTAAIEGTQQLLSAGLSALFGVSEGQSSEIENFVTIFLNNAIVRVDYYMYSYVATGTKWGMTEGESGMCYVADMAVIENKFLKPGEITFYLKQSLPTKTPNDFMALEKLTQQLILQTRLSKAMTSEITDVRQITQLLEDYRKSEDEMKAAFEALESF